MHPQEKREVHVGKSISKMKGLLLFKTFMIKPTRHLRYSLYCKIRNIIHSLVRSSFLTLSNLLFSEEELQMYNQLKKKRLFHI